MAGAKYIFVVLAMFIAASVMGLAQVHDDETSVQMAREREIIIIEPDEDTDYC